MVSTPATPKYPKKTIINEIIIANGILRFGFFASSPEIGIYAVSALDAIYLSHYKLQTRRKHRHRLASQFAPVVAITSKPTYPKKHFAAPEITPDQPNGRKPP